MDVSPGGGGAGRPGGPWGDVPRDLRSAALALLVALATAALNALARAVR